MHKTKLKYHLIFVSKFRKPILCRVVAKRVIEIVNQTLVKIHVDVVAINCDTENHIHIMIETKPTQSISMIVRLLKQMTAYYCWQEFPVFLRKTYWFKNLFWSKGYFCCTTGDASSSTVQQYIESQGN